MNQALPPVGTIQITVKREDLLHPNISGNKFRKLKYNVMQARQLGAQALLTFGGAFSNHIAATAAAGKEYGFKTIGVIRGEELFDKIVDNPTLSFAEACGMELIFVSREAYRQKENNSFIAGLRERLGNFYLLPEGGTNSLAVKGCEEILDGEDTRFTHICCAVGTGGTVSGLINSAGPGQQVLGFPALKADLSADIRKFARQQNWELVAGYDFGGYGKVRPELVTFINDFYAKTGVPLDPIYTGKMFFGVYDMIAKNRFPEGSSLLLVHTGGLQGIAGMNRELAKKKQPLIKIEI